MDEPTNGLDVHSQQLLFDALLLNDYFEHSTVLFSTHRVSEIERFADNIVVLHQGKLVTTGTAQSIMNNVQSWRFNVSSLDLITQSIKGICSIKQVDDTTYLTNLSSSNLTKDKLNALGATNIEQLPGNLSKAISAMTTKVHSISVQGKEGNNV